MMPWSHAPNAARRGRAPSSSSTLRRRRRRPRSLVRVARGGLGCIGARARDDHDLLRLRHARERAPVGRRPVRNGASAARSACGVLRSTSAPPSLVNVTLALRAAVAHGALAFGRRRATTMTPRASRVHATTTSRCGSERPIARACRAAARRSTMDHGVPSPPTPSTSCAPCASSPSVTTLTRSRRRLRSTRRRAPRTGSRTGRCGPAAAHHGRTLARVPPPSRPRVSERAPPIRTPPPVSACDAFLRWKERRRQRLTPFW